VIVHHIEEWHLSRSHAPENLAVLCLEHHDKAHTTSLLSANLTPALLRDHKMRWEETTAQFDARAILDATAVESDIWWYFNHQRLFQLALDLRIGFKRLPYFHRAVSGSLVDQAGALRPRDLTAHWMYSGGDGILLGFYVSDVLRAVLGKIPVFNVSDDLDRGILGSVIRPGDFIFLQGLMSFRAATKKAQRGPGQATVGRRKVNNVEIRFNLDRWEATSISAWSVLLIGRREASALLRVLTVAKRDNQVIVEATSLAIGAPLDLKHREYANAPFRSGYYRTSDFEEDEFENDLAEPLDDGADDLANYEGARAKDEDDV
jgi:hypothetical protein